MYFNRSNVYSVSCRDYALTGARGTLQIFLDDDDDDGGDVMRCSPGTGRQATYSRARSAAANQR